MQAVDKLPLTFVLLNQEYSNKTQRTVTISSCSVGLMSKGNCYLYALFYDSINGTAHMEPFSR